MEDESWRSCALVWGVAFAVLLGKTRSGPRASMVLVAGALPGHGAGAQVRLSGGTRRSSAPYRTPRRAAATVRDPRPTWVSEPCRETHAEGRRGGKSTPSSKAAWPPLFLRRATLDFDETTARDDKQLQGKALS